MSTFSLSHAGGGALRARAGGPGIARRAGSALAAALKRLEYGRMMQALERLPDHELAAIGLRRADIPAFARRLIYESD
jgi:uncharacterized protein YjiS (DUF1127 family)